MALGGILNVFLDPVFIFLFGLGVGGAALATCLSNTASFLFLLCHTIRHRKDSLVKISPVPKPIESIAHREIYSIGTPAQSRRFFCPCFVREF